MNKFDRILWRINGVLFLAILLYFLFVAVSISTHSFPGAPPRPKSTGPAATPQALGATAPLHLASASPIEGTPFFRMALETSHEPAAKFSSYRSEPRAVYNYLYLNTPDLSSWWLFDRTDKLITGTHDLRAEVEAAPKPVVATIWEVVPGDTDADGHLSQNDREAIYFCRADGRKPIEIIPPSDGLQSIQQIPPGQVLITYRRDDVLVAAIFSVTDGSKIKESVLPPKPTR